MPRILTNKKNLPLPIYLAIKNDAYEARGDISVTTLIDSPYIRLLRKYNKYEEDASQLVWSLMGQALHGVIERVDLKSAGSLFLPEKKLLLSISGNQFTTAISLSGTPDLIEKDIEKNIYILHDYKNIFAWVAKMGVNSSAYKKWTLQLNIYRYMIKKCLGIDISEIYIHGFIRDYSKRKASYDATYPEDPAVTFEIKPYSFESIEAYVKQRIDLHFIEEQKFLSDNQSVNHCSPEDRWTKPAMWKMMRKGKKKASKVFAIEDDVDKKIASEFYANAVGKYPDMYIDMVEGEDTRCEEYCAVKQFCKYAKERMADSSREHADVREPDEVQGSSLTFNFVGDK